MLKAIAATNDNPRIGRQRKINWASLLSTCNWQKCGGTVLVQEYSELTITAHQQICGQHTVCDNTDKFAT